MNLFRSYDVAVDIGTATMRAATSKSRPCEQRSISRNTPALAQGVVANPDATIEVLAPLLRSLQPSRHRRPRVLACAPTDATAVERAALKTCILHAGASHVLIVPEPLAAAVGAKIDIASKYAKLVIDFGEGVTDCALIHRGKVVHSSAVRIGCADLRRSIQDWVCESLDVAISQDEADRFLRRFGVGAVSEAADDSLPLGTSADLVRGALEGPMTAMLETVKTMLRDLPASFGAEVIEDGIFLTGGGALLPGMDILVESATGIHTTVTPQPLASVIHGARAMLPLAAALKLWR
jgi:rod shape-determining protein MreB